MSHDIGKSRNSTPRCLRLLPRQTTPHQYVAFLDCGKRGQTYSWCFCPRVYHHTAQYTLIDEPLLSGRIVGYSSIWPAAPREGFQVYEYLVYLDLGRVTDLPPESS